MTERLVILSDMWGAKKNRWITSYLGYLQQYFDIVFYDCQQLASMDLLINTEENICEEFIKRGKDIAVTHLLNKENEPSHYLVFCVGGTIAWKAGLQGLPMKSLFAISSGLLQLESEKPNSPLTLLYGERDDNKPSLEWATQMDVKMKTVPNFGRELYTDEKNISMVCQSLLEMATTKEVQF